MKTLSIRQPWASLIIHGYKPVENRTWKANYRGPLLIHAGKKYDDDAYDWIMNNLEYDAALDGIRIDSYGLTGGIIGSVTMIDCVTEYDSPWFTGPYGFVFTGPKPMEFRPCPGRLSFFDVPEVGL